MVPLKEALSSTVGKKYLMAASGLSMVGFVISHLLGNLQLYLPTGDKFNAYAKGLADFGPLLWAAEIGLLAMLVLHVVVAIGVTTRNKGARSAGYHAGVVSKGGPSYMSPMSRNMFITGGVLLVFLVVHVLQMKFGLFDATEPGEVLVHGEPALNLYARVVAVFQSPLWVAFYMGVMLFLGAHLRHGFWSAFQSLGALNERLERPATALGWVVAVVLTVGFFFIPIFIFVTK